MCIRDSFAGIGGGGAFVFRFAVRDVLIFRECLLLAERKQLRQSNVDAFLFFRFFCFFRFFRLFRGGFGWFCGFSCSGSIGSFSGFFGLFRFVAFVLDLCRFVRSLFSRFLCERTPLRFLFVRRCRIFSRSFAFRLFFFLLAKFYTCLLYTSPSPRD